MGLDRNGRGMVGHQQDGPLRESGQTIQDSSNDFLIKILKRLDLFISRAHMTGFVRCLNVQEEEIFVTQGGQTIFGFAEIIRIKKAGRSRHQDHLKSGQDTNTTDQINRGNN